MSNIFRKLSSAGDHGQGGDGDRRTRRQSSTTSNDGKPASVADDLIQQLTIQESLLAAHVQEGKKLVKCLGQVSKASLRVSNDLSAGCRSQEKASQNLASGHNSPSTSSVRSPSAPLNLPAWNVEDDNAVQSTLFDTIQELHTLNSMLVNMNEEFISNLNATIINPSKQIDKSLLSEVLMTQVKKKREELSSKIAKIDEKITKLSKKDKTGDNLVNLHKLRQQLESLKSEYENHEKLLINQLPVLINSTSSDSLLQPSLESLIKSLISFHGDSFTALINCIGSNSKDKEIGSWSEYREQQENRIKMLESLSIVNSGAESGLRSIKR